MKFDPTPLIGQSLSSVKNMDHSWFFLFSGGDQICTESSPWRLVGPDSIVVTSEDHGHQFGLPAPVDAIERVQKVIGTDSVTETVHDQRTGDLAIHFAGQGYLQFLQMSCGYESWRLLVQDREFICMGGGEYASLKRNRS